MNTPIEQLERQVLSLQQGLASELAEVATNQPPLRAEPQWQYRRLLKLLSPSETDAGLARHEQLSRCLARLRCVLAKGKIPTPSGGAVIASDVQAKVQRMLDSL